MFPVFLDARNNTKSLQSVGGDAEQAVKDAIDIGYRHIDTAFLYGNEVEVGNAVRAKISEGKIKREDIFVTTKVRIRFFNLLKASRWSCVLKLIY